MTMANPTFYTLKQELSSAETKGILDFIDSRSTAPLFLNMVQQHQEVASTLYRGIFYPLAQLEKGEVYRHFDELSSWSTEFDVARSFHQFDYVPEGFVEEMAEKMGYLPSEINEYGNGGWTEARNQFVPVVFVVENQTGFYINNFIDHVHYSKEKEVVLLSEDWTIQDAVETYDVQGNKFYVVNLE